MKINKPLMSVSICLRGHKLDPSYITKKLGIQPTRAQKKGAFKSGSSKYYAKIGLWTLKLKSESYPSSELIDMLLEKLSMHAVKLNKIRGVEDAELDILFAFGDEAQHALEFTLSNNQIIRASRLGLSVCVTIM